MSVLVAMLVLISGRNLWAAADEAMLLRLEQIIQQQQAQIDAQARAIEELRRQIRELQPKLRTGERDAPDALTQDTGDSAPPQEGSQAAQAPKDASVKEAETQVEAKIDAGAKISPQEFLKTGNPNVAVKLYGHVNEAVLYTDDGNDDNLFVVSNSNSTTRFGIIGTAGNPDGLEAGSRIEVQFVSNPSVTVNQFDESRVGSNNFTKRWLDLYFNAHRWGKLNIGYGDTASNNTAEFDLSGTAVVGYSYVADMAGGHFFYNNLPSVGSETDDAGNTTEVLNPPGYSETKVKQVFDNLDGLGRDDRIRYDTPTLYGFRLGASYVSGGNWDAALFYTGEVPGRRMLGERLRLPWVDKLVGAVGYANLGQGTDDRDYRLSGSLSAMLSNGLTFTAAGGRETYRDGKRDNRSFWYGKIGYRKDFFSVGGTAVAIDYGQYDGVDLESDTAETWGALLVQNFYRWGTEYYLGYRWHHLDRTGADFEDISAVMTGFRLKF
jgi:hypothetical protein